MSGPRRAEISVSTLLAAKPERIWERVITPEGINDEMRPLMRMTWPRGMERGIDPAMIELGEPMGRSWILLGGVLPFDYDEITVVRLDPGRGFLERSRMLSQRVWEHERTLEEQAGGCRVTDRVAWEPRPPIPASSLKPLIGRIFRHRHARLRRRFGTPVSPDGRA
jgi:hypothetical protein